MAIKDEDSARAWLEAQSDQRIHIAFAARSALRSAPGLGFEKPETRDRLALPSLRAFLVCSVAANLTQIQITGDFRNAFYDSSNALRQSGDGSLSYAGGVAYHAVDAADAAAISHSATTIQSATKAAVAAAAFAPAEFFSACNWDAIELTASGLQEDQIRTVLDRPLWPFDAHEDSALVEPEFFTEGYATVAKFFDSDPETWGFWKRWLEGMRAGQPMDWSLQKQIALIGSTDEDRFSVWKGENAPQRIAGKIEFIEARYEAAKANKRLQAALAKATQSRFEVGGNFPPEPLEGVSTSAPSAIFKTLTEATATLSEELEKEAPDKEELERSASFLRDALRKCRTYLAKTADNAAQKAVGTAAVSGSAELVSWISAKQSLIGALLDALQRLLPLAS